MNARERYAVLALLALCAAGALAVSSSEPLLYSLQKDVFPSIFHANTDVYKEQEINSTTDVLPLMQDLLDYTGPVVLNVRLRDVDQARHDLELFAKQRKSFSNLVLKLDMNESELDTFSKSSANQEKILQDLINSSAALDQLTDLEIQYRDKDNPTMLTSIRLQGETLRKKIRSLSENYRQESTKKTVISKKIGLDPSAEDKSVADFDEYVNEIDRRTQQVEIPIRRTGQLSLLISPDAGVYGDTIHYFGYFFSLYGYRVSSVPGKNVTLFIDNRSAGTMTTDDTGAYSFLLPVDRITAGTHLVHAGSGTTLSEDRLLTIDPVNSTTTLTLSASRKAGEILCTGTVMANIPVRNATVDIVWDGTHVTQAHTDARGMYTLPLGLRNGKHTLQARFTGDGYPLLPSESTGQSIVVGVPLLSFIDFSLLVDAAGLGLFALFAGGAVYYLRRREQPVVYPPPAAPVSGEPPRPTPLQGEESRDGEQPAAAPAPGGSLFERYTALLRSAGLSEASRAAYADIAARMARDLAIPRHRALTPRELSRHCRGRPYCGPFHSLVAAYERIRYGGHDTAPVQEAFETSMSDTDTNLGGGRH